MVQHNKKSRFPKKESGIFCRFEKMGRVCHIWLFQTRSMTRDLFPTERYDIRAMKIFSPLSDISGKRRNISIFVNAIFGFVRAYQVDILQKFKYEA